MKSARNTAAKMRPGVSVMLLSTALLVCAGAAGCDSGGGSKQPITGVVPPDIKAVFDKPAYSAATWGLRVVDMDTGQILVDVNPRHQFLIGSVRKLFSTGELLKQIGPDHTFDTPVYRQGTVSNTGVLQGNLVLVASGDLTMGGRTNPDGTIAISNFDHNEANSLGNAQLTSPDPLAGYAYLANQIAASGIKEISGDVVIDDRLFKPFNFREEFDVKPIFVNDDAVDVILNPGAAGQPALFSYRPQSSALTVHSTVVMSPSGTDVVDIEPQLPMCIGQPGCAVTLSGELPVGFTPPITGSYPLIRTYRITDPSSYARTVLIEELVADGVKVDAPTVEPNPSQLLPTQNSYDPSTRVALLRGLPYAADVRLINKVSYNIGADTSIVLYGLTQGADDMPSALTAEKLNLQANYGISPAEYSFVDGSGGGDTAAVCPAITKLLADMYKSPVFSQYFDSLPILGVDGSIATITDFESDPTLAQAKGQVRAKTGTFIPFNSSLIKGQAFAGYINTKSGRKLGYMLVVNDVPFKTIDDVIQVLQDEGTISAILWRDH